MVVGFVWSEVLLELLGVPGEHLHGHRAGEGELEEGFSTLLLVDLERMDPLRLSRFAEGLPRVLEIAGGDEHSPRFLIEGGEEARYRRPELVGDGVDSGLGVPRFGLGASRLLFELFDDCQGVAGMFRIVHERPAGKAQSASSLLAHHTAVLRFAKAEDLHLEIRRRCELLGDELHDGPVSEACMPVGPRRDFVDRDVLRRLLPGLQNDSGCQEARVVLAFCHQLPPSSSTLRAA